MVRAAAFSRCGRYRYALWRRWGEGDEVLFVMLNPSTADAERDDPTIRRCIGLARAWGFSGVRVANLFAWRATDPRDLRRADAPVGPANDRWLRRLQADAALTVAAWGVHGRWQGRDRALLRRLGDLQVLGLTREGLPRHPLYVRNDALPLPWRPEFVPCPDPGTGEDAVETRPGGRSEKSGALPALSRNSLPRTPQQRQRARAANSALPSSGP